MSNVRRMLYLISLLFTRFIKFSTKMVLISDRPQLVRISFDKHSSFPYNLHKIAGPLVWKQEVIYPAHGAHIPHREMH